MTDVRCDKCNKLLGKVKGEYEIKCPRCGQMNTKNEESVKDESKNILQDSRQC